MSQIRPPAFQLWLAERLRLARAAPVTRPPRPIPTVSRPTLARRAWRLFAWVGVSAVLLPLMGYGLLRLLLAPLPGEWTGLLRVGPLDMPVGIPSVIRLATSPWGGPLLDGHEWPTPAGQLRFRWLADSHALSVQCAPCALRPRGPEGDELVVPRLEATVQRDFSDLQGLVTLEDSIGHSVRGSWQAHLTDTRLRLAVSVPPTSVADGSALLGSLVPALTRMQTAADDADPRFSLRADIAMPNGALRLTPRLDGLGLLPTSSLGGPASLGLLQGCAPPTL